ncbi:response regulator [Gracilibacillus marinus]|uniref:Response regulator n=1 Tax=Gracilibacillus marinus TaxID=630535 RepID=A0ABV8VYU9_9BACI
MLKVMFVDDEPIIREGLCSIINWEDYGYQVVGIAKNGKEGLERILEYHPDLVFVDIQMPGLNGIDMVKKVKEWKYNTKFVVLSGYSNFTYAQQSIRLGIESYLLKPVDEDELIPLLQSIKSNLLKEKRLSTQLHQYEQLKEQQEWIEILHGKRNALYDQNSMSNYFVCSITCEQPIDWENIQLYINKYFHANVTPLWMEQFVICVCTFTEIEDVYCTVEEIKKYFYTLHKISCNIQLIDELVSMDMLSNVFQQLLELQKYSFTFSYNTIITPKVCKGRKDTKILTDTFATQLVSAMEFNNIDQISVYMNDIQMYYENNLYKEERLKADWLDFVKIVLYKLQHNHPSIPLPSNDQLVDMIYKAVKLEAMLAESNSMMIKFTKEINGFMSNAENSIEQITKYINQYYFKDLSLKVIAELFNYNSSYLGKKFKAYTGDYFHVYLDKVRLSHAKKLLKQPHIKVYQVSEKVGYSNIDYFYRKFKKYVGISPKEFQKQTTLK